MFILLRGYLKIKKEKISNGFCIGVFKVTMW